MNKFVSRTVRKIIVDYLKHLILGGLRFLPQIFLSKLPMSLAKHEQVRRVFPSSLLREFDQAVRPYLTGDNDQYLFGDTSQPHKTLLSMGHLFFALVTPPYQGKNLLEVGIGAGGLSYAAKTVGMDVISTDVGHGRFEEAGQRAREFLGLTVIEHYVSAQTSLAGIVTFQNGQDADWIIMQGVPFNRRYVDGKPFANSSEKKFPHNCDWYGVHEWLAVLQDVFSVLNPGGRFVNQSVYMLDADLAEKIKLQLNESVGNSVELDIHCYAHKGFDAPMANLTMMKHHDPRQNYNR